MFYVTMHEGRLTEGPSSTEAEVTHSITLLGCKGLVGLVYTTEYTHTTQFSTQSHAHNM